MRIASSAALVASAGLVVVAACDETKTNAVRVSLRGRVTFEGGAFLPGVLVTARCGGVEARAVAGDMGDYEIDITTRGCDRLVFRYEKESYASSYRSLDLPTTRTDVLLDVQLPRLQEIICGPTECSVEGQPGDAVAPASLIARGWTATFGGQGSLTAFPGEFFDTTGRPLLVLQTRLTDFRDQEGAQISTLRSPLLICTEVEQGSLDELQDLRPVAEFPDSPGINANAYKIDSATGRWAEVGRSRVVAAGKSCSGERRVLEIPEELLGDVRRGTSLDLTIELPPAGADDPCIRLDADMQAIPERVELTGVELCGDVLGSDLYAYGYPQAAKTCVVVEVEDPCGQPDSNATVEMFGDDRSFFNWAPTNEDGRVCLETHRSEVLAESQTGNGVDGETFWVNLTVTSTAGTNKFAGLATPTSDGSCDEPSTCRVVRLKPPRAGGDCEEIDVSGGADAGVSGGEGAEGPIVLQAK
jgi:hypothetical protein